MISLFQINELGPDPVGMASFLEMPIALQKVCDVIYGWPFPKKQAETGRCDAIYEWPLPEKQAEAGRCWHGLVSTNGQVAIVLQMVYAWTSAHSCTLLV